MAVLDTTIANVSVPHIAGGLAVSPSEGTWTITSYSVAEAITVPLTGWLSARFGTVRVFVTAMILFGFFSAMCGLSQSLGFLVFFRICQGLSGGPMIPLSQALLLRIFPRERAGQAIGLWGMTTVVGPIAGPLLGGWLCDNPGWPWVFYINVPIAALCSTLAWRMLKAEETPSERRRLDVAGLGLLVVWIGAMQIMLDKGKELDWFDSPAIITLALIAGVGFIAFLIWELTAATPVVDLKVFRHRSYATAASVMVLAYGAFFAANVLSPLWMQTNLLYTATVAGQVGSFGGILAVVMSPVVGRLVGKYDPRALITFGLVWMALIMLWRSTFALNIDFDHLILPNLLQGLALPFFFIPLMTLGTASLPPREIANGAALISFVRTTAGAFGTSIATTKWDDGSTGARVSILNQPGTAVQSTLDAFKAAGLNADQALQQYEGLVQSQSVMVSTDHMFLAVSAVLLVAASSVWIAKRPKRIVSQVSGH
jgi:DHA2 family multidrug resistance protein